MINLSILLEDILKKVLNEKKISADCKISKSKLDKYDYCLNNGYQIAKSNNINFNELVKILNENFYGDSEIIFHCVNNHLNFTFNNNYIINLANNLLNENFTIDQPSKLKIIVDYSSPNIAKDMHVGHLRSTIIGDTIANLYEKLGHEVLRINHIGDFGLPFGMIIQYILDNNLKNNISNLNLQHVYKKSRELYQNNEQFKKESYFRTVELQKNLNNETINIWKEICLVSKKAYDVIYNKLNINLKEKGESFYSFMFDGLVEELDNNNFLKEDNGRLVVLTPLDNNIDIPLTIVKSDGGFTYDTTDLCALKYRLEVEKADKIFYVVDSGQSTHFQQIFYVADKIGWKKENQQIEHINFGVVLGSDKKRLKSRYGDNPKLIDLLNESVEKTINIFKEKNSELVFDNEYIEKIAYGSIKYFDLSLNRTSDYIFSYDTMINFKGNTLIFVMYAYVRCHSIIKNVEKYSKLSDYNLIKGDDLIDKDFYLLKNILRLPEIIQQLLNNHYIHLLCEYLYHISEIIHSSYNTLRCVDFCFNEKKEIIKINNINYSRANIFNLCIKNMNYCFNILGIKPVDFM